MKISALLRCQLRSKMFSIIAAIGKNNELGKNGGLVFNIKEDMKFFKDTTTGHKVVMGYRTWKSLPKKLPDRENFVVSYEEVKEADHTITNLDNFIDQNKDTDEEIFIIGGGMVYTAFLDHAKNLYLTEIDATVPDADTFFPEFDKSNYNKTIIKKGSENGLTYTFAKYIKK